MVATYQILCFLICLSNYCEIEIVIISTFQGEDIGSEILRNFPKHSDESRIQGDSLISEPLVLLNIVLVSNFSV